MKKRQQRAKFWIYPYKAQSKSVQNLKKLLKAKEIKLKNSKYRFVVGDLVINWGSTHCPYPVVANTAEAVQVASSKQGTFAALKEAGIQVPEWTQNRNIAAEWVERGAILGRDQDRGSRGAGITYYPKGSIIKPHLFYVRMMKKEREFRIHVFENNVIFQQEKLKKKEFNGEVNDFIRSHSRGWVLAFNHLGQHPIPVQAHQIASDACRALGLSFGAVDIAWSARSGPTVLEVNTAPGIEESCAAAYAKAFMDLREKYIGH